MKNRYTTCTQYNTYGYTDKQLAALNAYADKNFNPSDIDEGNFFDELFREYDSGNLRECSCCNEIKNMDDLRATGGSEVLCDECDGF